MNTDPVHELFVPVLVATGLLVLLFAFVAMLLVVNANRRHRHRAELAELHLRRDAELRRAEREATEHTLTEVGRELHDNVGQLLTVAQVGLLDHLADAAKAHPRVATALEALDQGMEEVRRLGRSLNHDHWRHLRLAQALELEATRLERLGKARVHLRISDPMHDPPADAKTILFRAFQEVVANALRHSGARTLTIALDGTPPTLQVHDDGRGFDPEAPRTGSGLANIATRCRLVGYTATLRTAPGAGCSWTFTPDTAHDPSRRPGG
ncbi:MAG: hypothetical protein IPM49_16395 [Flavobacteriales bacterium]|nr:hypothetical protein [Flavobacteriales bacterium]